MLKNSGMDEKILKSERDNWQIFPLKDVLFTVAIQKNFDSIILSFMLHEPVVFLGCHSQFVSYRRRLHLFFLQL